jgi:hypothetical protein
VQAGQGDIDAKHLHALPGLVDRGGQERHTPLAVLAAQLFDNASSTVRLELAVTSVNSVYPAK